jgi:hypothetical protein
MICCGIYDGAGRTHYAYGRLRQRLRSMQARPRPYSLWWGCGFSKYPQIFVVVIGIGLILADYAFDLLQPMK